MHIKDLQKNEKGNAVFLILIAVGFFWALSYAVTQTGGEGKQDDRERAVVSATQIRQYASGLRTSVTRMIITGTESFDLEFDKDGSMPDREIFNAEGGGAIEQDPPVNAGISPKYTYLTPTSKSTGFFVEGVGTDKPDVILIATGLTANVCREINKGLELAGNVPKYENPPVQFKSPGKKTGKTTFSAYPGQSFACVRNGAGDTYVYYHVLAEN